MSVRDTARSGTELISHLLQNEDSSVSVKNYFASVNNDEELRMVHIKFSNTQELYNYIILK